jgi:hypothetical protein
MEVLDVVGQRLALGHLGEHHATVHEADGDQLLLGVVDLGHGEAAAVAVEVLHLDRAVGQVFFQGLGEQARHRVGGVARLVRDDDADGLAIQRAGGDAVVAPSDDHGQRQRRSG